MTAQPIDWVNDTRANKNLVAATAGCVAAGRMGTNTVVYAWSVADVWNIQPWNSTTTYAAGATVIGASGLHYVSEVANNVGIRPGSEPSFYWTLAEAQPVFVSGLNTSADANPTQLVVPFVFPTSALMQVAPLASSSSAGTAVTIQHGVAFNFQGDIGLLIFTGLSTAPLYSGTVG
jgi:hypothetical protein